MLLLNGLLVQALSFLPLDVSTVNLGSFSGFGDVKSNGQNVVLKEFVLGEMEKNREVEGSGRVLRDFIFDFSQSLNSFFISFSDDAL